MSVLRENNQEDQIKKNDRFYLRYYKTIIKARKLNQQIYGDAKTKGNLQLKIEHPLRVACHTEQIKNQTISQYHMTWLVGLLHDTKEDDFLTYSEQIDTVLKDLLPEEKGKVISYINQLTSDQSLSKGQKKRQQIDKMDTLELIPCWIRIFDKYDNCRRFRSNPVGNNPQFVRGYCAIAYLCYYKAYERFQQIRQNIQPEIKKLYDDICQELGGLENVRQVADGFINQHQ